MIGASPRSYPSSRLIVVVKIAVVSRTCSFPSFGLLSSFFFFSSLASRFASRSIPSAVASLAVHTFLSLVSFR
jgi:hypothetical protein